MRHDQTRSENQPAASTVTALTTPNLTAVPTTLTTQRFFDGTALHGPTAVTLDNGIVSRLEAHRGECDQHLISPGLVDLQMNGWRDIDIADSDADSLAELSESLWNEGTAHWLATIVTAPLDRMQERLDRLHMAHETGAVHGFVGVHVEGPFLGRAPGAHDTRHIVDVDLDAIARFPNSVRLVTVAPEAQGAAAACRTLRERGVVVSAGHSKPDRQTFSGFVDAGASMVTHLYNGMSGIHHRDGGMALWALTDDRLTLGLIADGCHVEADAVSLAFRAAADRICLVSDSVAWSSERAVARGVRLRDGAATLADGTLAGSATSLAGCLRWAVMNAGVDLSAALRSVTTIPARLIGRPDLGTVKVGSPGDLVFFDHELHVVGGRRRLASPRD